MFNSINFTKITATSLGAILMAGTWVAQPVMSTSTSNNGHGNNCDGFDSSNPGAQNGHGPDNHNHQESNPYHDDEGRGNCPPDTASSTLSGQPSPVGVSQLYTTNVAATASTLEVDDEGTMRSMNFGTGNNLKLTGFQVAGQDYSLAEFVTEVKFQRVNNAEVQGERHIFFLENGSNNDEITTSYIRTMEEAVLSEFINQGTDNVFANKKEGTPNYNNIERVDFLINNGLSVQEGLAENAGFLLLERMGNDPLKMAVITAVDAEGNPSAFGNLLSIDKNTWGDSGIPLTTSVFQNEPLIWTEPFRSTQVGSQNIHSIFVSMTSLGITAGQTIYGYAVFPYDIDANNDLVDLSDFPLNTKSGSNEGGLDLIASGGLFIPDGYTFSQVFTTPPQTVVYAD